MLPALVVLVFSVHGVPQAVTPQTSNTQTVALRSAVNNEAVVPARAVVKSRAAAPGIRIFSETSEAENSLEPTRSLSSEELDRMFGIPETSPAPPADANDLSDPFPGGSYSTTVAGLRNDANPEPPFVAAKVSPLIAVRENRPAPKLWYALVAAGHGTATFDAWTTRRVLSSGKGHELNPLLSPFAGNRSLYAAVQVTPTLFDYLGKRMLRSERAWVRKLWWVPQAAGAASSVFSGVHNLGVLHRPTPGLTQ